MARYAEHQALALPVRRPGVPIHRWLYAEMRAAILNGRLAGGQRLPPTRDLAHQFGIARGTAVAVFEQLVAEGYSPPLRAEERTSHHRCRTTSSPQPSRGPNC
jgi:GntR family transcriptional regulator/MocR family aminotransferase